MREVIVGRESASPRMGGPGYGGARSANTGSHQGSAEVWEQIRAAWSYISQKENAAKYDEVAVEIIKDRIRRSARNQGIEITD